MATISYKCDTCKRSIELVENPQGFTTVGKCVITNGCIGRLYRTERNPNNVRESAPSFVSGLDNYVPRRAFYEFAQTLASDKWKVTHNMGILPSTFVYLQQEDGTFVLSDNSTYKVAPVGKNTVLVTFPKKVRGIIQCVAKSTVPIVPATVLPESAQFQVSATGVITFAVPKYLTQIRGQIPQVSAPTVTPTLTPSPTPTQTPINMPLNLCEESNTIQIEIEITKPNEDPFVCFEDVANITDSRSPWNGWGEVLVGKRRNYCLRSIDLLKLKVFGNANLQPGDIPDGTRIRFLRIDYGTGRKEAIPSRGLLMLLAKSPYAYADKIKDRLVDVGELIGDTPDYFVYRRGELFLDESKVERSYPDISRVIYQAAPPQPSPTPTPTLTPTMTPTISVTPSLSATPEVSMTPTPTPTPTTSVTGTIPVTPTVTPTITVTPTVTPSATTGAIVNPFDYAVIRYSWTESNGRDLDTRTAVEVPGRLIDVGWNRASTDGAYLTWGGDNTSTQGPEAVLIDFNALATDYTDISEFQIRMRTFWYGTRNDGNITVTFETYLGGTMQHVGYDFVNTGGTLTGTIVSYVNSPTQNTGNIDGDDIGTLLYDAVNKTGQFMTEIPAVTPTPTPTVTPTISITPSVTPTISVTPSVTPTISITPTITPTISNTPDITPTISVTPTSGQMDFTQFMDCVMNHPVSVESSITATANMDNISGLGSNPALAGTWIRINNTSVTPLTPTRATMWGSPYSSNRRTTSDSNMPSFLTHAAETEAQYLALYENQNSMLILLDESQNPLSDYEAVSRNGYTSNPYASYRGFSITSFVYWDFVNSRPVIFDAVSKTYSIYNCPPNPSPTPTPTPTPT